MIIPNGTIQWKTGSKAEYDKATGWPTEGASRWSGPVECQYWANTFNALGVTQGERFTAAQWIILIETPLGGVDAPVDFTGTRIRLTDRSGRVIGEFPVISASPLDAVGQTKIIV